MSNLENRFDLSLQMRNNIKLMLVILVLLMLQDLDKSSPGPFFWRGVRNLIHVNPSELRETYHTEA